MYGSTIVETEDVVEANTSRSGLHPEDCDKDVHIVAATLRYQLEYLAEGQRVLALINLRRKGRHLLSEQLNKDLPAAAQ